MKVRTLVKMVVVAMIEHDDVVSAEEVINAYCDYDFKSTIEEARIASTEIREVEKVGLLDENWCLIKG